MVTRRSPDRQQVDDAGVADAWNWRAHGDQRVPPHIVGRGRWGGQ